eukprot:294469-Pyramimonas_sp.AAC.1
MTVGDEDHQCSSCFFLSSGVESRPSVLSHAELGAWRRASLLSAEPKGSPFHVQLPRPISVP